jgi:hypothetical protein
MGRCWEYSIVNVNIGGKTIAEQNYFNENPFRSMKYINSEGEFISPLPFYSNGDELIKSCKGEFVGAIDMSEEYIRHTLTYVSSYYEDDFYDDDEYDEEYDRTSEFTIVTLEKNGDGKLQYIVTEYLSRSDNRYYANPYELERTFSLESPDGRYYRQTATLIDYLKIHDKKFCDHFAIDTGSL